MQIQGKDVQGEKGSVAIRKAATSIYPAPYIYHAKNGRASINLINGCRGSRCGIAVFNLQGSVIGNPYPGIWEKDAKGNLPAGAFFLKAIDNTITDERAIIVK
jgi:hypothetical protein